MNLNFTNAISRSLLNARRAYSSVISNINSAKDYCFKNYLSIGWCSFAILLVGYFSIYVFNANALWVSNFIMAGGIFLTIMLSLLIALQGSKQSEIITEKKLKHQENLFLEAMRVDREESDKQIKAIIQLIQTVDSSTKEQIRNYTEQTEKVILNLKDVVGNISNNSKLLAEILKKELERDIQNANWNLQNAENYLRSVKSFRLGRDVFGLAGNVERNRDITLAEEKISTWQRHKNYLKNQLLKLVSAFLN